MFPGFGRGGGPRAGDSFIEEYVVYSMSIANKPQLENGGKILLPSSALGTLSNLLVQFPMLFKLTNGSTRKTTHCGVQEFIAEEGTCHLPYWMMQNLGVSEGQIITVQNVSLKKGTFVKLQPQSVDFLSLSNPKAVLEVQLRSFACLSKGDIIRVNYMNKAYDIAILETKPDNAVSIVEADVEVDFAAPLGYVEPARKPSVQKEEEKPKEAFAVKSSNSRRSTQMSSAHSESSDESEESDKKGKFVAFGGAGYSLKSKQPAQAPATSSSGVVGSGVNAVRAISGSSGTAQKTVSKKRSSDSESSESEEKEKKFVPFGGSGYRLK